MEPAPAQPRLTAGLQAVHRVGLARHIRPQAVEHLDELARQPRHRLGSGSRIRRDARVELPGKSARRRGQYRRRRVELSVAGQERLGAASTPPSRSTAGSSPPILGRCSSRQRRVIAEVRQQAAATRAALAARDVPPDVPSPPLKTTKPSRGLGFRQSGIRESNPSLQLGKLAFYR